MIQPKKEKSTATRQDSIRVLNSSLNFKKKIKDLKYRKVAEDSYEDSNLNLYTFTNGKIELNKDLKNSDLPTSSNKRPNGDVYLNSNVTRTGGPINKKKGRGGIGYNQPLLKKINDNQYLTSEQSAYVGYNTDLPNLIMDARIKPQKKIEYDLDQPDRYRDYVLFNEYDPLAVTPFDMLSDKDKKQRVKQYGNSGVPKSYNPNKPTNIKSNITIPNKPLPKVEALDVLTPKGIEVDNTISSNSRIINKAKKPKFYSVQEDEQIPYGLGTNNTNNIRTTTYEVSDPNNIDTREIKGKRTITPKYANGGEINPPNNSIQTDNDFQVNWYKNRVLPDPKLNEIYQKDKPLYVEQAQKQVPVRYVDKIDDAGSKGQYFQNENRIDLINNPEQGVYTHEKSHAINNPLQNTETSLNAYNQINSNVLPIDKIDNQWVKDNYKEVSNYNEIIPRISSFRQKYNLKPDQVITPELIKSNRDTYKSTNDFEDNTDQLYKLFDDQGLSNILNTVASNNKNTNVTYAAYGGNINSNIMNRSSRLPKNKRHIAPSSIIGGVGAAASMVPGIGTAVGAGLGVVSGLLSKDEQARQLQEQQQQAMYAQGQQLTAQDNAIDKQALLNYNVNGQTLYDPTRNLGTFSKGGSLSYPSFKGKYLATGGDLTSLNSRTEVAEGNTHGEKTIDGQYGITLNDGQKPVAEIEDQEVLVDNDKVYSDRLMYDKTSSYADKAKQIAKKAGRLETKLNNTTDTKSRNGYERALAGTKMAEEALFAHQEETKFNEGMQEIENLPTTAVMAKGGRLPLDGTEGTISNADFAKSIGMFTPKPLTENYGTDPTFFEQIAPSLIDNVGNYMINQNTPTLPKPIYNNAPTLETSVNVNPQLSSIDNTVGTVTNSILGNTNNSNTARANITSARLRGLQSKLGVLGEKENIERGLRNQDVIQRAQVNANNNELTSAYNRDNFTRTNDIQSRTSANLGNLSEDIDRTLNRRDQDQYYNDILLADILDDPTGEKIRTANRNPELFRSAKLRKGISKEAKRKALRNPYNYNNIIQSAI